MIDLYKIRILPIDEHTRDIMRACRDSRRWGEEQQDILYFMYACAIAQIPRNYWDLKIGKIETPERAEAIAKVKKYSEGIIRYVEEKLGVVFYGGPGVGKTSLAIHIAKYALNNNISTLFIDNVDLTNLCIGSTKCEENKDLFDSTIERPKILVIDNLGSNWSRNVREIMAQYVDYVIRKRTSIGPTIITVQETSKPQFSPSLESLIDETMIYIHVKGSDLRKNAAEEKFARP